MVTVYTVAYNEELMLPFFVRHYRSNFPDCKIVVFDNHSTDNTRAIAHLMGCHVIAYDTNNQLSDLKYLEIKNHCWQFTDRNHWVIIADVDELCQITQAELEAEWMNGATLIRFAGYNMVNMHNNGDVANITHGIADENYSKSYCFNRHYIKEINYTPGCHTCKPVGEIKYSARVYPCYHYKYIQADYMVNRYSRNLARMSEINKRHGMGSQYAQPAARIRREFSAAQQTAQPVRRPMQPLDLAIFIAGFDATHFTRIPDQPHLHKVNLSELNEGDHAENALSEHRLFLSAKVENITAAYVGLLTWRWHQKCRHLISLQQVSLLPLQPDIVYAAWPEQEWYSHSVVQHKGIQPYLDELAEFTGLPLSGTGLYGNQFICSKEVFEDFLAFFRNCFAHFHQKYGFDYKFWVRPEDANRTPAVFYERVACIYFANRQDLTIKPMPTKFLN